MTGGASATGATATAALTALRGRERTDEDAEDAPASLPAEDAAAKRWLLRMPVDTSWPHGHTNVSDTPLRRPASLRRHSTSLEEVSKAGVIDEI